VAPRTCRVQSRLALEWREWLTNKLLGQYFADRSFYQLQAGALVDNPGMCAVGMAHWSQQFTGLICLNLACNHHASLFGFASTCSLHYCSQFRPIWYVSVQHSYMRASVQDFAQLNTAPCFCSLDVVQISVLLQMSGARADYRLLPYQSTL
jgi:hypothetical protein